MTRRLEITPEAERDIFAITANIQQQDCLAAAKHTALELKKQLQSLTRNDDGGRVGGCDGTREIVLTGLPFIAVFEKGDQLVTIVRILYGANAQDE